MMQPRAPLVRTSLAAAIIVFAAVVGPTTPATARTIAGMVYDLAVERPIGLAETVVGVAVAGVAYPFALASGKTERVVEHCIAEPGRYTFTRSLGVVDERPDSSCSPVGLGFGLVRMSFGLLERPLGLIFGRSPFADDAPGQPEELEVDAPSGTAPRASELEV